MTTAAAVAVNEQDEALAEFHDLSGHAGAVDGCEGCATTAAPAVPDTSPSPRVEPEAALELVSLVQGQLARMISEHECRAVTQPHVAYQLAGALDRVLNELQGRPLRFRALDASVVAYVRRAVLVGRRLDMTRAFDRLNPGFGVAAEHGCWDATAEQRARRAAVRRRELELAMGERFARMLAPAEGGGAA